MLYKLTFEDGSSGYLEHFGVKGMHWGVWNDETRARRMGYHEIRNVAKSSKSWAEATSKMRSHVGDARSEQTKKYRKNMDDSLDALLAYQKKIGAYEPEEHPVFEKASNKAAKEYIKSELSKNGKQYRNDRDRMKLEEYAYEEVGFDAGKKAFNAKFPEYRKLESAWNRAFNNYTASLNDDVDRLVKADANKNLDVNIAGSNTTAKHLVRSALDEIGHEEYKRGRQ